MSIKIYFDFSYFLVLLLLCSVSVVLCAICVGLGERVGGLIRALCVLSLNDNAIFVYYVLK